MAKNRMAVTCNGRAAFYAAMWEDIRQCAMDNGWAVALHGSLASDMDIMSMPWVETAIPFDELANKIAGLFDGNDLAEHFRITYNEKPHGRIVATIPIWDDFYLDISTLSAIREKLDRESTKPLTNADSLRAMSDEELAVMLAMVQSDLTRLDRPVRPYSGRDVNDNMDWLQQPAEEHHEVTLP